MQAIWRSLWLLLQRLLFLATLALASLLLFLLPSMLVSTRRPGSFRVDHAMEPARWWEAVSGHLGHLLRGQLVPPNLPAEAEAVWRILPAETAAAVLTTLKLVGLALAVSLALGLPGGWLMSRLAPVRLRRPVWAVTTALACLPDLLVATFMNLSLFFAGAVLGRQLRTADYPGWHTFYAPAIALVLLVAPYIARVVAAAIDEVSGELYIRTAIAKGLHPRRVLFKHIGKSVLLQVWSAFPVMVSMLLSGAAIVEYMTEVRGIGRALVLAVGGQYGDSYVAVYLLFPVLLIVAFSCALSDLGRRWLDLRSGGDASGSSSTWQAEGRRQPFSGWSPLNALRGLMDGAAAAMESLGAWLVSLPAHLRSAAGALRNPLIATGGLLVAGLVAVAILAPELAPFDPNQRQMAFQDGSGNIWTPPFTPGQLGHLLGTDTIGRDVWSRLVYGTRYAILFAGLVVPARFLLALLLGMAAAWWGGAWARLVQGLGIFFAALPQVLLPLALIPVVNTLYRENTPASLWWGVFLVALPGVPRLAEGIRQQARAVLGQPFVEGAVAAGAQPSRILWRHVLPQMLPQLITMATMEVPQVMTFTAALAYFHASPGGWIRDSATGEYVVPALPEWGAMMETPIMVVLAGRWWMLAPFAALFLAVLSFSLLGEGLRRHFGTHGGWGWPAR